MEVKELMVDDWVYNKRHKENIQITPYDFFTHGHLPSGRQYFIGEPEVVSGRDLEPIPLTQEILEKNEFIGMPYAILKIDDNSWLEYYYHEHRLIKWWSGIDEWESHSKVKDITFQCHCIYVHELQHALRLCGIEKEIIL